MSNSKDLPVKKGEDFIGELEHMDLSELRDKTFMVAINAGDPNGPRYVNSSIRGPFSFDEMCEAVANMWRQHQHHAKVIVCSKDFTKPLTYLDANTIDFIEANYDSIMLDVMLDGALSASKPYTCKAGTNEFLDG